jgi:hypothetical protein
MPRDASPNQTVRRTLHRHGLPSPSWLGKTKRPVMDDGPVYGRGSLWTSLLFYPVRCIVNASRTAATG